MTDFIGRGEERTVAILKHLFPKSDILQQTPIQIVIRDEDYAKLGPEHNKHKFDILVLAHPDDFVIEVNYKHGVMATQKWFNVYEPLLKKAHCLGVTIDDNECESLFQLDKGEHENTWQDWIDVIRALENAGVKPR